jgi:multiple sugar transport system ATP-binding protein
MANVTYNKASRIYPGSDSPAVDQLELEIEDGEFLVLVGPSGCGKSTALRMLAGLEPVDRGAIHIGDRDVTHVAPKDRDIAMVFQNYALYPHMTVAENMGFALKIAGVDKAAIEERVKKASKILDLDDYLERKPKALSGGQRQRVAMGRAIVREPQVFLMDEPLSNLDAKLRVSTRTQIASLQHNLGITTLYVTHDQIEAMTMGDRVAVLKFGVLQQVDTPLNLYERPGNVFVAGFIGSPAMNIGEFEVDGEYASTGPIKIHLPRTVTDHTSGGSMVIGFRPEGLELASEGDENAFPVDVDIVEALGSDAFVYAEPSHKGGQTGEKLRSKNIIARVEPHRAPKSGETVYFRPKPDTMHFFSGETGQRINPETGELDTTAAAEKPSSIEPAPH